MLDTLLEQERAVSAVLAESTKASNRDLIQSSNMVCKMTYIPGMFGSHSCNSYRAIVCREVSISFSTQCSTHCFKKKHLVTADTDPDITVQLKTPIADNLKAHFLDREFALLASAVDPRYKRQKFLDSSERRAVFRILVEVGGSSR